MLGRTSWITHKASGVRLETPLLIPSFSSKGSQFHKGRSEIEKILEKSSEFIDKIMLVSAYDIYHEQIPSPSNLHAKPELIVLDSGGYEASDDHDLSAANKTQNPIFEWSLDKYKSVLDAWPEDLPVVIVSYDHPNHRYPLMQQVEAARLLFKGRSQHLTTILLKPETSEQII